MIQRQFKNAERNLGYIIFLKIQCFEDACTAVICFRDVGMQLSPLLALVAVNSKAVVLFLLI